MGGQFSVGKHYESSRFGVFTEEIFEVKQQISRRRTLVQVAEKFPPLGAQLPKKPLTTVASRSIAALEEKANREDPQPLGFRLKFMTKPKIET